MTQEEELLALRLENQELRIKIRKHRKIGEQAELDLRELRRLVGKACAHGLPQKTDPTCAGCLAQLARLLQLLRAATEDGSPSSESAVD